MVSYDCREWLLHVPQIVACFSCSLHASIRIESFRDQNRPGVVRNLVKTTIPISLTDVEAELTNTSKIVAKVMIRQALIDEVHRGNLTP